MKKFKKAIGKCAVLTALLLTFSSAPLNAKTVTRNCTYSLKSKSCYVGLNKGGACPATNNWSSSNHAVATVSGKGDGEGGHKVTFKKKGKTTISCKITSSKSNWKKGDVYKWVITIK